VGKGELGAAAGRCGAGAVRAPQRWRGLQGWCTNRHGVDQLLLQQRVEEAGGKHATAEHNQALVLSRIRVAGRDG